MTRTAAIAFPFTLFLAWWLHVVVRAGNGPGFQWSRVPNSANFTATVTGVLYLAFVVVALVVLYFTRIRGQAVSPGAVVGSALLRFAATYVAALVVGIPLAEWFCVLDERAFRRETAAHLATAVPDPVTHDLPTYSRLRWWPANSQTLVSPIPDPR